MKVFANPTATSNENGKKLKIVTGRVLNKRRLQKLRIKNKMAIRCKKMEKAQKKVNKELASTMENLERLKSQLDWAESYIQNLRAQQENEGGEESNSSVAVSRPPSSVHPLPSPEAGLQAGTPPPDSPATTEYSPPYSPATPSDPSSTSDDNADGQHPDFNGVREMQGTFPPGPMGGPSGAWVISFDGRAITFSAEWIQPPPVLNSSTYVYSNTEQDGIQMNQPQIMANYFTTCSWPAPAHL